MKHASLPGSAADSSRTYDEGFVAADRVRLHYLDWGGARAALIFIHGLGDNPYIFTDLAPAFTSEFRVIAYARRGHGRSEAKPPYDTETLTDDLCSLMNALHIAKADLVGWSMGGNEITSMAATHPTRVRRIVYLDGAYDYADPDAVRAIQETPPGLMEVPPTALASLTAYRSFQRKECFPRLDDIRKLDDYIRQSVTLMPDGRVKLKVHEIEGDLYKALIEDRPRDYSAVRCPALAIYAEHMLYPHAADPQRRSDSVAMEQKHLAAFRERSIARVRRELRGVEIARVPGGHADFFLTSRDRVVSLMKRFFKDTDY